MSALLAISGLTRRFSIASPRLFGKPSVLTALDNVSVTLGPGETLGVVGESGSGKSTLARLALGIDRASSGSVSLFGQDVTALSTAEWRVFRRRAQYVFQDSSGSLNPRMTAGEQIREGLEIHDIGTALDRARAVEDALAAVRLDPALADRYPHELSGGQQQRVVIARAIVLKPELLVADEPVSALDLTVQAEIVDLLSGFQKTSGTAMMLISHDLNVVRRMADRVVVLYLGRVVEEGETQALYAAPRHPYTAALLSAAPRPRHHHIRAPRLRLKGDTPNALTLPSGCALHPRCPFAIERCRSERPELSGPEAFGTGGHRAACHRADEVPGLVARHFSGDPVHA